MAHLRQTHISHLLNQGRFIYIFVYLSLTSGVLFYCIRPTKRHSRCLQVALRCLADVNNMSAEGTHVFKLMCEKADECTPMCLIMLDEGADPNATDQVTN